MDKPTASLPPDTVKTLNELRTALKVDLYAYVIALRRAGWPLRAIGEAVGVTRVTVFNWEKAAKDNEQAVLRSKTIKVPALPLGSYGMPVHVKKIPRDIPTHHRARIAELAPLARQVRRWTDPSSPEQKAANELEDLIELYVLQRKVPVATFARYAGVTRRAIMQRIEKM